MAHPKVNFSSSYSTTHHHLRDLQSFNARLDLARSIRMPVAPHVLLDLDALPVVPRDDNNCGLLLSLAVYYYVGQYTSPYEVLGPRAREQGFCSLLHLAVMRGYTSIVRLLLEWGADPNDSNELQRGPLHMAAAHGDRRVFSMLLEHGADPKAVHISGKTAIHFACQGAGDDWLVGRLLDLGLDVNAADRIHRNTPLHLAAKNGRLCVASLLIKRGADLNARNWEGYTPAHLAAQNTRMLKLLLEGGADLKCTDARGRTPLQLIHLHISEAARTVIKHLVMEEAITGIPMDKANANYIESQLFWRVIRDDCLVNIESMKKIRCFREITCFKLLTMSVKELAKRLKRRRLLLLKLKSLFPEEYDFNYDEDLNMKIEKVFEARNHTHRAAHFVHRALGDCLPQDVTAKIGEFLRPEDIRFN